MNTVRRLRGVGDMLEMWPFLLAGLPAYNGALEGTGTKPYDSAGWASVLFKMLNDPRGGIAVLTNKRNKPLGYGVAYPVTDPDGAETMFIYYTYSTGECPSAVKELFDYTSQYARSIGIRRMGAVSPRTSGAAARWFEKKMKFRNCGTLYLQDI